VALNAAALSNGGGYRHIRADKTTTNMPSMPNLAAVSSATLYSFWIDTFYDTNIGNPINNLTNMTFFVCVRAYSDVYLIESGASDIGSIFYTNTN
jgi:hypothetical protein